VPDRPGTSSPTFRSGDSAVGVPSLVVPADGARRDTSLQFIWRAIPEATAYRLEVLDADGGVLLDQESRDTTLSVRLPSDGAAPVGWWVVARTRDGVERRSPLRRFAADSAR
jgi:hypothetical protein